MGSYTDGSIFLALLALVTGNQCGEVVLRACIEPLWGDAEKIAAFYADAQFNATDPEWEGFDCLNAISTALENCGLTLPPPSGYIDDPLALTPDGKFYLDPAAASAHLQRLMEADENNSDALTAVQNASVPTGTANLEPAAPTFNLGEPSSGQIAALESQQIVGLQTTEIAVLATGDIPALSISQI